MDKPKKYLIMNRNTYKKLVSAGYAICSADDDVADNVNNALNNGDSLSNIFNDDLNLNDNLNE